VEIIVVDSASTDETPNKARECIREHLELNVKFVEESVRRLLVSAS